MAALFAVTMALARTAAAAPEASVWKAIDLPDRPPATFTILDDRDIEVATATSAGFLYREAAGTGGQLAWRWRVDRQGRAGDLMRRGQDDRPLAVHLWFPDESIGGALKRMFAELVGYPAVGRVMTYVWAAGDEKGKRFANPYLKPGQGVVIVLRDARDGWGTWRDESVDFTADYWRAFGSPAPAPRFLAVSGDSDDLGGTTLGRIAMLRFEPSGPN